MNIKSEITHLGETKDGGSMYLRRNKCGQWVTIRPTRKGYRWDAINYPSEYPVAIWRVSQKELEEHIFCRLNEVLK